MKNEFYPIFTATPVISNQKTTFHSSDRKVYVSAPGKLMRNLVEVCDGTRTLTEVVKNLSKSWDKTSLQGLLGELRKQDVMTDSRNLSVSAWKTVENPQIFPAHVTEDEVASLVRQSSEHHRAQQTDTVYQASSLSLGTLLGQRSSTRSFAAETVPLQSLVDMLWSAYGEVAKQDGDKKQTSRRTVPSAGALYPLGIHVALLKKTGAMSPGVYSVHMTSPGKVGFRIVSKDTDRVMRAFLDPLMPSMASGIIVISGSLEITSKKYGNRSMLYVPLEAGHVAQNIHLAAIEREVGTVEIGGFMDKLLAEAISLPEGYQPLTTVVFGKKSSETQADEQSSKLEIEWATTMQDRYHPPFAIASARVLGRRSWSNGRDPSPILAHIKAVAEAKEWASCGNVPDTLVDARFKNLKKAIDPRTIIKFHPAQYRLKEFPFGAFDETAKYAWTVGQDEVTGAAVHILADHVYFPYFPKTPYYAYANSSGVAAHPNRQKAVETSTLELVERDAFMIAYLTKIQFPTVSETTLPESIKERVRKLRQAGFKVWIKDHSLDMAPVATVVAQSEELGCTTCASCSSFDIEHAVSHALMEVEAFVLARLQNGRAESIRPDEVAMPLDHGAIYDQKRYFRQADFLVGGKKKISFQDIGRNAAKSWQELLDRFAAKGWKLYTLSLFLAEKHGGNGDLHIIRSIVPGMVPMTFGYKQEPAGMERIYGVAKKFGNKTLSYKDLSKFPHPFA